MAARVRHLAINATDVQRVKAFYETVFGWRLEPWGPPDYYQDQKSGEGVVIALHGRRELAPGPRAGDPFTTRRAGGPVTGRWLVSEAGSGRAVSRCGVTVGSTAAATGITAAPPASARSVLRASAVESSSTSATITVMLSLPPCESAVWTSVRAADSLLRWMDKIAAIS